MNRRRHCPTHSLGSSLSLPVRASHSLPLLHRPAGKHPGGTLPLPPVAGDPRIAVCRRVELFSEAK